MFTHTTQKDYIFKHTFNVPPLVPLVRYNFKQTKSKEKKVTYCVFCTFQIRGSNDTTCMCVFHLYSCVSIISQYCYILQEPALSLICLISISCLCVCFTFFLSRIILLHVKCMLLCVTVCISKM